jgi:hypothetical protein
MCDEKLPPDEELTKIIVGKLLAEGLIPERRSDAITNSILAGTASEGDWRSWVYTAQVENEREEVEVNAEEAN